MNSNQEQNNEESMDIEKIISEEMKINDQSINDQSIKIKDKYKFGWSNYSEITNGRFAMLGFLAILLIELISQKSFLTWAGIF